jgi:hypothetical protein
VFDTHQTCLCRVPSCAECSALSKGALCREPNLVECGTRQSLLCRVPDKRHSTKNTTLGKACDSGSEWKSYSIVNEGVLVLCFVIYCLIDSWRYFFARKCACYLWRWNNLEACVCSLIAHILLCVSLKAAIVEAALSSSYLRS